MVSRAFGVEKTTTVDQVYNAINPGADLALSAYGLSRYLAGVHIANTWKVGIDIQNLFVYLVEHRPVIALINYSPLVKAGLTEKTMFLGAHFVVVAGMDIETVFINDPYTTGSGEGKGIPLPIFQEAWKICFEKDGNPNSAGLVMDFPIKDVSVPEPVPDAIKYEFGMNGTVQINGINVRGGPGSGYPLIATLWRTSTPFVMIVKMVGEWGLLVGNTGWVYMPYLKKI